VIGKKKGVSWRDMHEQFGLWKTVYNAFKYWSLNGSWARVFDALVFTKAEVNSIIDGTIVRAHQDASGGRGGPKKTR
jgi:transposase